MIDQVRNSTTIEELFDEGTVPKEPLEINCDQQRIVSGLFTQIRCWNFRFAHGVNTLSFPISHYVSKRRIHATIPRLIGTLILVKF